jgi:hypothetical protein
VWGRNGSVVMDISPGKANSPEPLAASGSPLRVEDLWARLDDEDRVALLSALGDGLLDARWAVQEMSQPGHSGKAIGSLLASLNRAILELSRARKLLADRSAEATLRTPSPSVPVVSEVG